MAVSRLRPTPETGVVAATKQAATPIGPSWSQRAGRSARLAFRQATRRNDPEGAMALASKAEKAGLDPTATIGSAEERLAGQYQQRRADTAAVSEAAKATAAGQKPATTGTTPPATTGTTPPATTGTTPPATTQLPPTPEAKPVPGASQPPENPVTGEATPETGDAPARLGARPAINPLTKKPFGFDPRAQSFDEQFADFTGATPPSAPQGSKEDQEGFLDGASRLTTVEGGDLTRKAAVEEMNRLRTAAGQPPVKVSRALDAMLERDRTADKRTSAAREDPRIAARKAPPLPKPPPAAQTEAGTPTAANPQRPIALPLTAPPIQGPQTPFAAPVFRTSATSPEARLARLKEAGKQNAAAARDRKLAADKAIDDRVEEKKRNIKIPEWQQGTILGRLNRRFQEFSAEASR